MSVAVYVAWAKWAPERAGSMARLLGSMGDDSAPTLLVSAHREPSSVWALRLWRFAADFARVAGSSVVTHFVFLNDDVTVCPNFTAACEAIAAVLPDEVVSLHTTAEEAECSGEAPRWLRSYWLTGPGYMVPRARLRDLLRFAEERAGYFACTNEDNFLMQWAWSLQRPIWHCVPALVEHDARVPSTQGFGAHAGRVSRVTWKALGLKDELVAPSFWEPRGEPRFVECPWFGTHHLAQVEAMHHAGTEWSKVLSR